MQKLSVRWSSQRSSSFNVSNRVRQGGVLSPVLFTIYVDVLLLELRRQGVGCYWNSYFAGAYAYADDWAILAPSASALRQMLSYCESFASLHGLKFNPAKTQLIKLSAPAASSSTPPSIKFCGTPLGFSNTVVHLSNTLSYDLSDSEDILNKCRDMLTKFNALLSCFPYLDPSILTNLFQSYCLSLHGSALWNISSRSLQTLEVSFNKVLRRIWKLPHASHTAVVHCTARLHTLFNQVLQRSYRLLCSAEKCPSVTVRAIFRYSSELCYTFVGYNMLAGFKFAKIYSDADVEIGSVIRSIRSSRSLNILGNLDKVVQTLSSSYYLNFTIYTTVLLYSVAPIVECLSNNNNNNNKELLVRLSSIESVKAPCGKQIISWTEPFCCMSKILEISIIKKPVF